MADNSDRGEATGEPRHKFVGGKEEAEAIVRYNREIQRQLQEAREKLKEARGQGNGR